MFISDSFDISLKNKYVYKGDELFYESSAYYRCTE